MIIDVREGILLATSTDASVALYLIKNSQSKSGIVYRVKLPLVLSETIDNIGEAILIAVKAELKALRKI